MILLISQTIHGMSLIDQARSASPIPLILSYKTPISVLSVTSVVVNPLHCRKLTLNLPLADSPVECIIVASMWGEPRWWGL